MVLHTLGFVLKESVNLCNGTVEGDNGETVVGSIEDQVLTHDGQTDETKVSTGLRLRGKASSNAGQARSKLAQRSSQWDDRRVDLGKGKGRR